MKFQKAVNIWSLSSEERAKLKPGQWVFAGQPVDKGVWCGQRSSGSDVVAWYGNAKNRKSYNDYVKSLMQYAKG